MEVKATSRNSLVSIVSPLGDVLSDISEKNSFKNKGVGEITVLGKFLEAPLEPEGPTP